jgi:hypothetical protein
MMAMLGGLRGLGREVGGLGREEEAVDIVFGVDGVIGCCSRGIDRFRESVQ